MKTTPIQTCRDEQLQGQESFHSARARTRAAIAAVVLLSLVGTAAAMESATFFVKNGWMGSRESGKSGDCYVRAHDSERNWELKVSTVDRSSREMKLGFPHPSFEPGRLVETRVYISSKEETEILVLATALTADTIAIRDVYPSEFWTRIANGASLRVYTGGAEWTFPLAGYEAASGFLERCTSKKISRRALDPDGDLVPMSWPSQSTPRSTTRRAESTTVRQTI